MNEFIVNGLITLGLGEPIARTIFGASLGLIPVLLKVPLSYYKAGDGIYLPKEFTLFASADTPSDKKTYFHYLIWPIIGALYFTLFL